MRLTSALCAIAIVAGWAAPSAAQDEPRGFARLGVARIRLVDEGKIFIMGTLDPAAGYKTPTKWTANLDLGFFVLPSIAIQGSATAPVTTSNTPTGDLAGTPNLGNDKFSIFTLTATYHPLHGKSISPYVGGGLGWQHVWHTRDVFAQNLEVDDATGPVIQGGVDFAISKRFGLYVDAKKAFYSSGASADLGPAHVTADAKLDPLILQAGALIRF